MAREEQEFYLMQEVEIGVANRMGIVEASQSPSLPGIKASPRAQV